MASNADMKDTLTKLATGLIAKLLRYAITSAGAAATVQSDSLEQTAGGIAAVVVAIGWSLWEDSQKAKSALAAKP